MDSTTVAKVLLDASLPLSEQHRALTGFLKDCAKEFWFFREQTAHAWALRELRGSVAEGDRAALETAISAVASYHRLQQQRDTQQQATTLRALTSGTRIIVNDGSGERTLTFRELRRTRFLAEDENKALLSVPALAFCRISEESSNTTPQEGGQYAREN